MNILPSVFVGLQEYPLARPHTIDTQEMTVVSVHNSQDSQDRISQNIRFDWSSVMMPIQAQLHNRFELMTVQVTKVAIKMLWESRVGRKHAKGVREARCCITSILCAFQ